MNLQITPKALASASIGSVIPAGAAVKAALAGNPFLLEQLLASALKSQAFMLTRNEKKAEKEVARMLKKVKLTVEFA